MTSGSGEDGVIGLLLLLRETSFPANICWSSRRLQHMSSRNLQQVFSVTISRLPKRLEDVLERRLEDVFEDVLKTSWRSLEDVLKKSWRRLGRRKIVALKICLEEVLKTCLEDMSWGRLEDILEKNKILTGNICIPIWG